jgi:hypothetical protein
MVIAFDPFRNSDAIRKPAVTTGGLSFFHAQGGSLGAGGEGASGPDRGWRTERVNDNETAGLAY